MRPLQPIECTHAGTLLRGLIAVPDGAGPFPAVLVMHSALGLRHMVGDTARKLADLGYLAVATDMYGADADFSDDQKAGAFFQMLGEQPQFLRDRCTAWFDHVAAMSQVDAGRMAAIGYCFGGKCVLELARSGRDVKAAVSYHGTLETHAPARPREVRGMGAAWGGGADPYAPQAHIDQLRAEMQAAGTRYQITLLGGVEHGFTDPDAAALGRPGIVYDAAAAKVSWAGTLALLQETIGQ